MQSCLFSDNGCKYDSQKHLNYRPCVYGSLVFLNNVMMYCLYKFMLRNWENQVSLNQTYYNGIPKLTPEYGTAYFDDFRLKFILLILVP